MIKYFISTGCSFTDVPVPEIHDKTYVDINEYPDKALCWPVHVNNHLGTIPCYKGNGASGNGIISKITIFEVLKALKTYDKDEILVGIMWSGSYRHEVYLKEPLLEHTKLSNLNNPTSVGGSKNYYKVMPYWHDELSLNYYKYIHDDLGSYIQTIEHILRVQWFLKLHNIKYFMTTYYPEVWPSPALREHPDIKYLYEQIDFENFLGCKSEYEWCASYQDPKTWEGNDHHPNTPQHKAFAEHIIIPYLEKKGWI